ncbi:MAG: M3 family oligoendopeptidase [Crocinitomicaceae bacterium]|nr:M3 family oligoendopeptidase [Crocinitomicaceae bacterium]
MKITAPKRNFVAEGLIIDDWLKIEGYFKDLVDRKIDNLESFKNWLRDQSELEAILEEDMAWRYIKMTIDTKDEQLSLDYSFFVTEIAPKMAPFDDLLNKKLMNSQFKKELENNDAYKIYFRSVQKSIELFREENIPLQTQSQEKSKEYGTISAAQSIEWEGETLTMQQASNLLKKQDEVIRKEAFQKMVSRRSEDVEALEQLFDDLIVLRHKIAVNAGYKNYRDYKFDALGRFDYTKEDCFDFHAAIKEHIVPMVQEIQKEHANKMGKERIKPWDSEVDPDGKEPLVPFKDGKELLNTTKSIFKEIDPFFGDCLQTMDEMKHLDLDSKAGKAPGGYNYPLYEIGVPFIFMNAASAQRDVVTMIHEGGHAVHSFLSRDLDLTSFKNLPSEVAELASMSMELLSMDNWNAFYDNEDELNRAKKEQLVGILRVLPWIATIDAFQHWIYENPTHSREERKTYWKKLQEDYGNPFVDWAGYEESRTYAWHRQLHLFEVPFYYIEYGISQLGAIGVWKNALQNKEKAIADYKAALALGYTKDIPTIYETANLKFDFSSKTVQSLAQFVQNELKKVS